MFLLVGHVEAVHEQKFGSVQTDAVGCHLSHRHGVLGQFDVGEQPDGHLVAGDRRFTLEFAQFALLPALFLLFVAVIAQDALIQPDQDYSLPPIDDNRLIVAQIAARIARAHHRRNTQATRQNGGVG